MGKGMRFCIKKCSWHAVTALLCGVTWASSAHAEDSRYYGLLRMRDLTPFGFLRLDMRPAHAVSIDQGTWAVEFELGYQNTWALSKNVENYLTSIEPQGRHTLGPDDVRA